MNKYLILEFKNAGLFKKNRDTKDKSFDMFGRKERKEMQEYIEPITVFQVSNMIHVLFGERPVPINREVLSSSIPYLFEKALQSYIKIDSYKDSKGNFQSEKIQTKKAVGNSWSPVSYMYWERVSKLLDEDLYKYFIATLNEVFKINVIDKNFSEIKRMIKQTDSVVLTDLFNLLKKKGCTSLYEFVYNDILSDVNKNPKIQFTVVTGLDKIIRLNGQIVIPVNDDDINKIKQNKGCATILDGGIVYIKGIKSENVVSTDGFTQVKDISLKTK
jgi:hypothetical protein